MADDDAPICFISNDVPDADPSTGGELPNIPTPTGAGDANGMYLALLAMKNNVDRLAGRRAGKPPKPPKSRKPPKKPKDDKDRHKKDKKDKDKHPDKNKGKGRWIEDRDKRKKKKVKVRNPKNKKQFVEVEIITGITMVDKVTGELWIWSRGGSSSLPSEPGGDDQDSSGDDFGGSGSDDFSDGGEF